MEQRPETALPLRFRSVSMPFRADPNLRRTTDSTPKTFEKIGPMRRIGLSNGAAT
jgi:hypothetical protein